MKINPIPNYGEAGYWDDRYDGEEKGQTFEWLQSWKDLKNLIEKEAVEGIYKEIGFEKINHHSTCKMEQNHIP